MKLKVLTYFFECYNIPALRYLYPTNDKLWKAFRRQEGEEIRLTLLIEINWVLKQEEKEKKI